MQTELSRKLIVARENLRLTLSEAAEMMPNTRYTTLQHLEGRSKAKGGFREPPDPGTIQLRTAVDLIVVYWPAIQLIDLMPDIPHPYLLRLGPR